jgi:hypothetical protein
MNMYPKGTTTKTMSSVIPLLQLQSLPHKGELFYLFSQLLRDASILRMSERLPATTTQIAPGQGPDLIFWFIISELKDNSWADLLGYQVSEPQPRKWISV